MLEPSPQQIKEEEIYKTMGLTTEEFAMAEKILGRAAKLYRNRSICGYVVRTLQLQKFKARIKEIPNIW